MYDAKRKQKNIERARAAKGLEITLDVEDRVINAVQDYYKKYSSTPNVGLYVEEPDAIVLELKPPALAKGLPEIRGGAQDNETKKPRKRTLRILTDEKAVDAINAFVNSKSESEMILVFINITRSMELRIVLKAGPAPIFGQAESSKHAKHYGNSNENAELRK